MDQDGHHWEDYIIFFFFIDPAKLLPLPRFLPQSSGAKRIVGIGGGERIRRRRGAAGGEEQPYGVVDTEEKEEPLVEEDLTGLWCRWWT